MRSSHWFNSRLIGIPVRNGAGVRLGTISDLIIDPTTGQIEFVIVALDRIGVESRYVPVPWNVLGIVAGRDYVLLDLDKITLDQAPSFTADEWPDFADSVGGIAFTDTMGSRILP